MEEKSTNGITFRELELARWRQFEELEILFHPRLTVITGQNGTGKSTILSTLASCFRMGSEFVNTPEVDDEGSFHYSPQAKDKPFMTFKYPAPDRSGMGLPDSMLKVGSLVYSNLVESMITLPKDGSVTSQLHHTPVVEVQGFYSPSHIPKPIRSSVENISIMPLRQELLMANIKSSLQGQISQGTHPQLKQTLISMAYCGPGNALVLPDGKAMDLLNGFKAVLASIIPSSIGFEDVQVISNEIVLKTGTGNFSFDAISGGLGRLINLTWEIFLMGNVITLKGAPFVVLLDEPENHLHPEMQKALMPALLKAFPSAQFIVGTHSPFIVTAEDESHVYSLSYNAKKKVESKLLSKVNRAGSANETLTNVLGLGTTMPVWATVRLEQILREFKDMELSDETLERLSNKLQSIGLSEFVPQTVANFIHEK